MTPPEALHPAGLGLSALPDEELDARIDRFGRQMLAADMRFKHTHAIEDRAERDRWWLAKRMCVIERARRRRVAAIDQEEKKLQRLEEENKALRTALKGKPA